MWVLPQRDRGSLNEHHQMSIFSPSRAPSTISSPAQIVMLEFHAVCTRLVPKNATMARTAILLATLLAVVAADQISGG